MINKGLLKQIMTHVMLLMLNYVTFLYTVFKIN